MLPTVGPFELLLVLILALLLLGPGKLPEVGQALGKTIREFRRASLDGDGALKTDEPSSAQPVATVPDDRRAGPLPAESRSETRLNDEPVENLERGEESRAPGR